MKLEQVIDGLVAHARPTLREVFGAKSCIPATKVCMDVLAHYGHKSLALPVEVFVASGPFADHVAAGGAWPRTPDEWRLLGSVMYAMVLGGDPRRFGRAPTPPDAEMWDGHLVAWAPDGPRYGWMIDASLDQASRPAAGVNLPGCFAVQVSREFRKGGERQFTARLKEGGPVVQYRARPDNTRGYRTSPLWRECDGVIRQVARVVIDRIEGRRDVGILNKLHGAAAAAVLTGSKG